jgi:Ni/Co efflux regulator RcnB
VYWDDLPYDYYGYMPPPPYGCRYVAVDRDVLLIVVASGLILDALIYDGDWRGRY